MPGYLIKVLQRLQQRQKVSQQYSPYAHIPIKYAIKNTRQYTTTPETLPLLDPKETQYIQSITGSFLYYGHALDFPIRPVLDEIVLAQTIPI